MENLRKILTATSSRLYQIFVIAFSFSCQYSRADSVINVCDQATLSAAVAAGGTITFDCDGTIVLTNTLVIGRTVTLDGSGHNVTISGNDSVRVFSVPASGNLTLIHLTVQNGRVTGATGAPGADGETARGAGILISGSGVRVVDCVFQNNQVIGGTGGADSLGSIGKGGAAQGAAIYNGGKLSVTNTVFLTNVATGGTGAAPSSPVSRPGPGGDAAGGALFDRGSELRNCQWRGNRAVGGGINGNGILSGTSGNASGGAIFGSADLDGNWFEANSVSSTMSSGFNGGVGGSCAGGAVFFSADNQSRTFTNCTFIKNQALGGSGTKNGFGGTAFGGALAVLGPVAVVDCRFEQNDALGGRFEGAVGNGGGIYNTSTALVTRTWFTKNSAIGGLGNRGSQAAGPSAPGNGGALYNSGVLTLLESTISGNVAKGGDGGLSSFFAFAPGEQGFGGGIFNSGTLQATNSTIVGNAATGGDYPYNAGQPPNSNGGNAYGGAVFNAAGSSTFVHNTIAGNSAVPGVGITNGVGFGGDLGATNGTITLYDSIVAQGSPTNCFGAITDGGGNLSSDSSCNFSASGSLNNTDPVLGPLDDYGGPTPTMPLLGGSPAIDAALAEFCPATDQRGRVRPYGPQCDIGAFESSPPYTIRGRVRGFFNPGQVLLVGGGASAIAGLTGDYRLDGIPSGTYPITPTGTNLLFVPSNHLATVGPDVLGLDFTAYRMNGLLIERNAQVFHGTYAGTNGQTIRIEYSTDLIQWPPFQTNSVGPNGLLNFYDTNQPGARLKAFRTLILE